MKRAGVILFLLLASCIEVPELDRAVPDWVDAAEYPELVSLDGVQNEPAPEDEAEALEDQLTARANRLKRKADGLNQPVVDPDTRRRMADGVNP